MKQWLASIMLLLTCCLMVARAGDISSYFFCLKQLKFEEAKQIATLEKDSLLSIEMVRLADLLFYAGQKDKKHFPPSEATVHVSGEKTLSIIRFLNAGYFNLFYDQLKGNAYRNFYKAYQLAMEEEDPVLTKACIFAFLKYYGFEIAQNSDFYQPYLQHFERLRSDPVDDLWLTIYKMIFYSKSLKGLDDAYFTLSANLDDYENNMDKNSPLLANVFYEKALKYYLQNDLKNAADYYLKTVNQSAECPFLKTERFLSFIKLMLIAIAEKNLEKARGYMSQARQAVNHADTLRSNYYLNLYGSLLLNAENKNDSAFHLLRKAYLQDFQLDYRRNTLEINRLTVELETQEKENANLRLREGRIWLLLALLVTGLISLATWLAYANQRVKNKIQRRETEVKVEKLLKEQELLGINSMLDGQEKERKRIANELHDNLGSLLTTLKFHFHAIRGNTLNTDSHSNQLLEKTDKLIAEAYEKVRTIAHVRNAGVNAQEGLLPAVKNFASKVSIVNSLVIEVNEHGMDKRLENTLEITAFRIIQELIANILKHAEATAAIISLTQHEQSINIMVEDNGIGFDVTQIQPSAGMGLHSIQKRVENAGGNVTIESIPKNGTTVIIDLPII